MLNNGLTKGVLFLSAANIHRAFDSKSIDEVRGAMRRVPLSGTLFLFGFFAITGSPPFGPFVSEFLIVSRAFAADRFLVGGGVLLLLLVVFVGMGRTVLAMVQGLPSPEAERTSYQRRPAHGPAGGALDGDRPAARAPHPVAARGPAAGRRRASWRRIP